MGYIPTLEDVLTMCTDSDLKQYIINLINIRDNYNTVDGLGGDGVKC